MVGRDEQWIASTRLNYPPDTRLTLIHMEDKWAVPPGTRGTVDFVDDAGQIHMKWDNGRTLAIVPQVDKIRKLTQQELLEEQGTVPTQEMSCDMV